MRKFTLAVVTLSAGLATAIPMPAEAGGWGRGPSWSQARKIVEQAGKDIGNGAQVVGQTTLVIGCAAAGAAIGTALSANPTVAVVGAGAGAQACSK